MLSGPLVNGEVSDEVRSHPFSHILVDNWLDKNLYGRLASSFPHCPANSGPTGYTLFRGDPEYDRLMSRDEAWATFFNKFHRQEFIDHVLNAFPSVFQESRIDLSRARFVRHFESREDKERLALDSNGLAPDDLWVRMDILQGRKGYHRVPHVDHRRRAASMLIYFCDADEAGMKGGDLVLHGEGGKTQTVRPRHNRMVIFPCADNSIHSVTPIRRQSAPRNFVQVIVSSCTDLWEGQSPRPTLGYRVRARLSGLAGRVGLI
jgi:predicted 2-oxoglutarate/Fe(II)-dependent dioxygenase YbiX